MTAAQGVGEPVVPLPTRVFATDEAGLAVSVAALLLSVYLWSWGMIGFRPWSF